MAFLRRQDGVCLSESFNGSGSCPASCDNVRYEVRDGTPAVCYKESVDSEIKCMDSSIKKKNRGVFRG